MVTVGDDVNLGPEILDLAIARVTSDLGMVEENCVPFCRRIGVTDGGFVSTFCV